MRNFWDGFCWEGTFWVGIFLRAGFKKLDIEGMESADEIVCGDVFGLEGRFFWCVDGFCRKLVIFVGELEDERNRWENIQRSQ